MSQSNGPDGSGQGNEMVAKQGEHHSVGPNGERPFLQRLEQNLVSRVAILCFCVVLPTAVTISQILELPSFSLRFVFALVVLVIVAVAIYVFRHLSFRLPVVVALVVLASVSGLLLSSGGRPPPPPPYSPKLECDAFFPTMRKDAPDLETRDLGDGVKIWSGISTRHELDERLKFIRSILPALGGPKPLDARQTWRAVLWEQCSLMEQAQFATPAEAFEKFGWLVDVYVHRVAYSGPQVVPNPTCSEEEPLPDNAIRVWRMWTAYENGLYETASDSAKSIYGDYVDNADAIENQLERTGTVAVPPSGDQAAMCVVFKNGAVNDVAAALWVRADSLQRLNRRAQADSAWRALTCLKNGLIYNRGIGNFWRPIIPRGRTCRQVPVEQL